MDIMDTSIFNSIFEDARKAGKSLGMMSDRQINGILTGLADETMASAQDIMAANMTDLAAMDKNDPMYDRLLLTEERIAGIAADIRKVAGLASPCGETIEEWTRPNGMKISKVRVPFGTIGIIFEARPNVTFDVFSLCIKSGNACVLKGGSNAHHSNKIITELIRKVLERNGADKNIITLLPPGHDSVNAMLGAKGFIDLIIPRGGKSLINFVRDNSRIPVIETGAGICHTYFDRYGDTVKGSEIIFNAKTRRVSVCNALDCLIIHKDRLEDLPSICMKLASKNVEILADNPSYEALRSHYPATLLKHAGPDSFGTEFLAYRMAVKTVNGIQEAVSHIDRYSSRHSEAIISEHDDSIAFFRKSVDAACVYTNVPTSFTDGGEFGFGAEIGISTQKLHARGPMGLKELTTYKYIISGNGQIRK